MLASPAKRRKLSPITAVSTDASNARPAQSTPSTPKRASYQSPTKASLARSHPGILARSPGRSVTSNQERDSRKTVLNNGALEEGSQSNGAVSKQQGVGSEGRRGPQRSPEPVSFSAVVAKTFQKMPPEGLPNQSSSLPDQLSHARSVPRSSLRERPNSVNALLKSMSNRKRGRPGAENEEPELPPNPVQLGLDMPPDRPRGLSSSSPRSSRSGSGRRRRRGATTTSSPLKQKDAALKDTNVAETPILAVNFSLDVPQEAAESDIELGEERPPLVIEKATEDHDAMQQAELDEHVSKRALLTSLAAQLSRLQSDLSALEIALQPSNNAERPPPASLLAILTTNNPSCASSSPHPRSPSPTLENPTALGSDPMPYLTLFAPGNLQLSHTTTTTLSKPTSTPSSPTQTHTLTLSAPPPFPAHIFGLTLLATTDPSTLAITSLTLVALRPPLAHKPLRAWLTARLASNLHRHDIAGLVWGVGKWWNAAVRRARIWRRLQDKRGENVRHEKADDDKVAVEDVKTILPLLEKESLTLDVNYGGAKPKGKNKRSTKLLVRGELGLDWTAEVEEKFSIAVEGSGAGEKEIKELFAKLVKAAGVEAAVRGIMGLLRGEEGNGGNA